MRNYLLIFSLATLVGCASVVMYEGERRPDDQVAKLWVYGGAKVEAVNGKVSEAGANSSIAVLPGELNCV